ncbi:TolC family protein [Pelagicoccus mobilis]|uniref:TolC family protein n=1 Tax=Pelagicoccus mobilis TaxID=415221 RepID=A0A934RWN1_9BACT|nr:TolC family protein [Pelagicoccus mobilis]MBK1876855.1 TolC family protein [Pelagicoccus mobilis]
MLPKLTAIAAISLLGLGSLQADQQTAPEEVDLPNLITLALQRDFQIRIVGLDKDIAEQGVKQARGYWDPAVRASHSNGSLGGGGGASSSFNSQEGEVTSASIATNISTGGRITLDAAAGRFENNFGRQDTYAANAGLALYQPLLRNFGSNSYSFIKVAKRNLEQSEQAFKLQAIATVTNAITLYNQTALRKGSLQVAEQSRELTQQLVEDTLKRAELGTVEARGVEVAETRLSQREANVVLARRLYLDSLNELKRFVSNEALALVNWQIDIGAMPAPEAWSGNLSEDFEYALLNRPDYLQAKLEIEKAIIDAKTAENATLPSLDLNARAFRTNFGDSFTSSYKGLSSAETDLFLGVTFSRPLLNRSAGARKASALIFRERTHLVEKQLKQSIAIQLDNAARRISSEAQSRELARQGREFAERSLEAEERKLKLGQSTTYFVLEAQEDLTRAQVRELDAIANYNIAVARYHQVKGSTLAEQGIQL